MAARRPGDMTVYMEFDPGSLPAITTAGELDALREAVEVLEEIVADYEDEAAFNAFIHSGAYVTGLEDALRKANEDKRELSSCIRNLRTGADVAISGAGRVLFFHGA